jgi:Malectin domain
MNPHERHASSQGDRNVGSLQQRRLLPCVAHYVHVVTVILLLQLLVVQGQTATHIRVNCGGPTFVDSNSNQWTNDVVYNLGNKGNRRNLCSTTTVQNAPSNVPSNLYCSQRYYTPATFTQPYQYDIPVPNNAFYIVKLHFAELVRKLCCYIE